MLHDPKREASIEEELFHAGLHPAQRQMLEIADIFRQRGWCQHVTENSLGQVCLFGAVDRTAERSFIGLEQFARFVLFTAPNDPQAARYDLISYSDDLVRYNDAPGQTMHAIIRDLQYCALG